MATWRSRFMSSLLIFLEQRYSLLCTFIRCLPIISTLSNEWTWCFLSFISCDHLHTVHIVRVSNILTNAIYCSIWLQRLTTIVCLFIFVMLFLILGWFHFSDLSRWCATLLNIKFIDRIEWYRWFKDSWIIERSCCGASRAFHTPIVLTFDWCSGVRIDVKVLGRLITMY